MWSTSKRKPITKLLNPMKNSKFWTRISIMCLEPLWPKEKPPIFKKNLTKNRIKWSLKDTRWKGNHHLLRKWFWGINLWSHLNHKRMGREMCLKLFNNMVMDPITITIIIKFLVVALNSMEEKNTMIDSFFISNK